MTAMIAADARTAAAIADDIEAAAYADLMAAAPPALEQRLGLRAETLGGITALIAPALPSTMFNRAIGLGMSRPASGDEVDALIALYRSAGVRQWWLHWNPHSEPAALGPALPARGFALAARRSWAKMLRGAAPLDAPTSLTVAPAADAKQWAAACVCIAQAFQMPPFMADWLQQLHARPRWQVYAISDGGVPVGGACLFIDGDVGWLGMGSVSEAQRRRGGQLASMARRIADAAAAGCRHIATETGEPVGDEPNPSLANMARAGFRCVASRLNYEWKAPPG